MRSKFLDNFKKLSGIGVKPQGLLFPKEHFERVREWFCDRKALPILNNQKGTIT